MKKSILLVILTVLILLISLGNAVEIEDRFNVSIMSSSQLSGFGGAATGSNGNANVIFNNISAIAGTINIKSAAVLSESNGPVIMSRGSTSVPIALCGAGDSYSKTRALGTLSLRPISNITGYVLGSPTYSATSAVFSLEITLDDPLTFVQGDTATFRIYNRSKTTSYEWYTVVPNYFAVSGDQMAIQDPTTYLATGNIMIGVIGSETPRSFESKNGVIYGFNAASNIHSTTNYYQFENIFTISDDTNMWSMNKNIEGKTTLSQFNITDGNGNLIYYPLDALSHSDSFITAPVTLHLVEPRFNNIFDRTYLVGNSELTISPPSGPVTTNFTGLLSMPATIEAVTNAVSWTISPFVNGESDIYTNGNKSTFVKSSSTGHWLQWDGSAYTIDRGTTIPKSLTFNISQPGTYTVSVTYLTSNNLGSTVSASMVITGGAQKNIVFRIIDSISSALLVPSTLSVKNIQTDTWSNYTLSTSGEKQLSFPEGTVIGWIGSSTGYVSSSLLSRTVTKDDVINIPLYQTSTSPAGNVTIFAWVKKQDLSTGIESATVRLTDGQTKTTPSSGMVSFIVATNTTYQITVNKAGYNPLIRTIETGTEDVSVSLELSSIYVTTSPTLGPGETSVPPTLDTRSNAEKDQDMADMVRDAGPGLLALAILALFLGLVKLMGK